MWQQRMVSDGHNPQTKLPIHGHKVLAIKVREAGSTVYQTWFSAAAILTLPNLQLSAIPTYVHTSIASDN